MDIENLRETALLIGVDAGNSYAMSHPELGRAVAAADLDHHERGVLDAMFNAVIALTLKAAAEEVEAWSHNSTGTRDPEQAMQEAAQDTLAEKIADRFLSLAAQAENPHT